MTDFNSIQYQMPKATMNDAANAQQETSPLSSSPIEHTFCYHYFLTYFSRHKAPKLGRNEEAVRRLILDFKEGKDYAREFALQYVCDYLRSKYTDEELRDIYFAPVPAATMDRSCDRWCIFTHDVCRLLHTRNGYDVWCNDEDRTPTHISRMENGDDGNRPRNYFFTKDIQGARVIIFDDVKDTGASIRTFAEALREEGAEVIEAVTLAYATI